MGPEDYDSICRVCLDVEPIVPLHPLDDSDIRDLFEECTSVKVQIEDNYPNQLCNQCFIGCLNWYDLKRRALKADDELKIDRGLESAAADNDVESNEETRAPNASGRIEEEKQNSRDSDELSDLWEDVVKRTRSRPRKRRANSTDRGQASVPEVQEEAQKDPTEDHERLKALPKTGEELVIVEFEEDIDQGSAAQVAAVGLAERGIDNGEEGTTASATTDHVDSGVATTAPAMSKRRRWGPRDLSKPTAICEFCGKFFYSTSALRTHIKYSHGEITPMKCRYCEKLFVKPNVLAGHEKRHFRTTKNFKCELCEKAYYTGFQLREHIEIFHENTLRFRCTLCDREFKDRSSLRSHMADHTGFRPHRCEYKACGMVFKLPNCLRRHQRVHAGEKFECDECGYPASKLKYLTEHKKLRH